MRSDLRFGIPRRRADGHLGARATVAIAHEAGWHQDYSFDTHGMTSAEVAAEVARIESYHADKANRLSGFRKITGSQIVNGGVPYRIVDCTIFDAGVTLYVDVRPPAQGFPLRKAYHRIEAVPSDGEIVGMVIAALPESDEAIAAAHAEFVAKVEARRG